MMDFDDTNWFHNEEMENIDRIALEMELELSAKSDYYDDDLEDFFNEGYFD